MALRTSDPHVVTAAPRGVRRGMVAVVIAAVLTLTAGGCSSSDSGGGGGGAASPSGAAASCGQVKRAAHDFETTVKQWQAGNATRNDLVSSANGLLQAVGSKADAATGQAGKEFSALGSALRGFVTTLATPGVSQQDIKQAASKVSSAAAALGTTCR